MTQGKLGEDLLNFLIKIKLDNQTNNNNVAYTKLLSDLGISTVEDIIYLEDEDIQEMNFKKIHLRKFKRAVNNIKEKQNSQEREQKVEEPGSQTTQNQNKKPKFAGPKKRAALLFIGETGVGKSTLLDSLRDYMNGVKFDNIKPTKKTNNEGKSETQHVSQETLSNDKYCVTIIDTPGLGDTGGIDKDNQHMGNIVNFLGDFGDFNAVCVLLRRGSTRKTSRLAYIINEFRINMPKDVQDNFIVIFTRCEVPTIDLDSLNVVKGLKLPIKNIIPVNNIAYEEQAIHKELENSMFEEQVKARQRIEYYANHQFLEMLIKKASTMKLYQGQKIKNLKRKRDKLKEQVGLLKSKISESFKKEQEMTDKMDDLKRMDKQETQNIDWEKKNETTVVEWYRTGNIITHCNSCGNDCHPSCGLSHGDNLSGCACAGSGGQCTRSPHHINFHSHKGWQTRTRKVYEYVFTEETRIRMKSDLQNAKKKKESIRQAKIKLENEKKEIEKQRKKLVADIQNNYKELSRLAIIGHNESYEEYLKECRKAISEDQKIPTTEKKKKLKFYDSAIEKAALFFQTIKNLVSWN